MQFIDLEAQQKKIISKIKENIEKVYSHGKFIMGPEVIELEKKLSKFTGSKFCISVSSGTDALLVAMMALGIGNDDEIITTPFTWISASEMASLLGAKSVFVDIDPETYNIDAKKIEEKITKKTKLIIATSIFGQCPEIDEINAIAKKYSIPVIEDAAQSLGATYKGKKSCNLTLIGCTSFFPSKPLGCYGDGGACFTNDQELYEKISELRLHGQSKGTRYKHNRIGINGRLDTIQAAILLAKLEIFENELKSRSEIGNKYTKLIQEKSSAIKTPRVLNQNTSVYAQYTVQLENRDQVAEKLKAKEIPTAKYYPVPLNQLPLFKSKEKLPVVDKVSKKVLSLPIHPYLEDKDQKRVAEELINAIKN